MLAQSIEKNFLIDPLTKNNEIYRDSLTLSQIFDKRKLIYLNTDI